MGSNWIDIVQSVDKGDTFVLNFVSLCPVQSDPPILIKGKKSHPILSEFGKKIEALKSFWPHTNAIKFNTSFTRASGNFVWRLRYEDNSTQNFNITITSKPSSKTERIFNLCVPNNAVVSGVPTYNIEQYINEDNQSTATQNNEHELNCSPHGSVGNEMAKNTEIEEKNLEPVSYHEDIYGSKWFLTDSGNLIEDNSTSGTALPIDNFHTTSSQPLFTENNTNHNNNSNHHSHNRTDPFMAYFDSLSQAQQETNNNLVQPLHTGINSNQEHDTPNSELASASLTSESGSKEKTLQQPGFEPDDGHTHISYQHYQSGVVRQETQLHIIPVDLNNSNGNSNNNRSQQHNGDSNHRGVLPPRSLSNGLMPGQSISNPLKRKRDNIIVNKHNVKKPKVVIKTNNYFTVNEVISTSSSRSSSDFDRSDESQSDSEDSFCVRCGYTNHSVEECYATRTIDKEDIGNRRCCYRCGHPGHFAPNCYARKDKWGNRL